MFDFIAGPEGALIVGATGLLVAILLLLTSFPEQDRKFEGDSEDG